MKGDNLYIGHILNAADDIGRYVAGVDFGRFSEDTLLQDGVMRKLEIIGEAAKRLSPELCDAVTDVPWKDICGMRDKLVHDYFGIDLMAVWKTAAEDIGALKTALEPYRLKNVGAEGTKIESEAKDAEVEDSGEKKEDKK